MGWSASARTHNQERIRQITALAATDLEALALLFEDDGIRDDGTTMGRVYALLHATERRTIPGLQTAIPFGDSGFAEGFRDPWPASRNQVGHFLTALGLRLRPKVVSRPLPLLGSIRAIVAAPPEMSDAEVALRLTIGHEKLGDPPNAVEALLLILADGFVAARWSIARDGTAWEHARRIGTALLAAAWRQARGSLDTFRAQFNATTRGDVAAWQRALRAAGRRRTFNRRTIKGPRSPLRAIGVHDGEGNSAQDLRLSLAGWWLGQMIERGTFRDRRAVAAWIRRTLG